MKNHFMNALGIIINALAGLIGLVIKMNAPKFCTDGKVVYLPTSNNRKLLLGGGVHEAAQCKFSDFSVFKQIKSALEKHVSGILEDIFAEKSMINAFPGTRMMLSDMVEELISQEMFTVPRESTPTEMVQTFMLYRLRADVLEQKAICAYADQAEELVRAALPAGMMIRLESLIFQVEDCKSSQDVLALTRAIITMMEDEKKKEEEKEQQQAAAGDQSDDTDPGLAAGDDQSDDADPDLAAGDDKADDATHGSDPSDVPAICDDIADVPGQSADANQQAPGDDSLKNEPKASDIIKSILDAGDDDAIKSTNEALVEAFGACQDSSAETLNSNVVPFKCHSVQLTDEQNTNSNIDAEKNRVAGVSNALRVRAQSLLQAQTMSRKRNVLMGTKLNVKNLHQAKLGGPVFQQETKGVAVDTAILVLVDRSTSQKNRIGLATDAALATTMAFQRPDVKTAVFTFPYTQGEEGNGVLKGWNAMPSSAIPAYQSLGVEGCTPMAEAMMGAGLALMQRPEKRKILLVATDGEPDDTGAAQWVINLARKSGIEVLGLGILCDTSNVFGQQWSRKIDCIDNLPVAMIGMLDSVMLKRAA
jgi:cobalamin biosynthesis protein CobT